ncbi:hypothetical protein [Octadecabacter ascidiaceicola]|nr:hypothetical protein [Octadecabacter ascidiaceicola]
MKYLSFLLLAATPAFADAPVVEAVTYSGGSFSVSLSHPDTGWDHYADGWRVELADGTILGTRVLAHPHVNEQPFTRSSQIIVPEGVDEVFVRTSNNVDGWADETTPFALN